MYGTFQKISKISGKVIIFGIIFLSLSGCKMREDRKSSGDIQRKVINDVESLEKQSETLYKSTYNVANENDLIDWKIVREIETEKYYIKAVNEEEGNYTYPQIVMKIEDDTFYEIETLNKLIWKLRKYDYNILYADEKYICLWYGSIQGEKKEVDEIYTIFIQSPNTHAGDHTTSLVSIQDDNDYPNAPWPSNGLKLPLKDILNEIGNCETSSQS